MRDYNIDREGISSEEISTFKDFKSIMRKHAQTTEDLAKIKPAKSSNGLFWGIGGAASVIAISLFVALSGTDDTVVKEEVAVKPIVAEVVETPTVEWQTVIRTPQQAIEEVVGLNEISADRVDFAEFKNIDEVESLLKGIKKTDAGFIANSLVFKLSKDETIEMSSNNDLFHLNKSGEWVKVSYNPVEMPELEKPTEWKKGEPAVNIDFGDFEGPASKYKNIVWKPLNLKDLDDSYYSTPWEDASVKRTSVNGMYTITLRYGEVEKNFNAYPALYGQAYKKAMKEYNAELLKIQEEVKTAPKTYSVSKGVYTVK